MNDDNLSAAAEIFKALGHPARLLFVQALAGGERCVCELQALVDIDTSTVSRHLAVLKHAGVLREDKRGRQVYYSLRLPCVTSFLQCVNVRIDAVPGESVACGR